MRSVILGCVGFMLVMFGVGFASVPQTISYQGVLQDTLGHPVADGPYNITFRLYNVANGGSSLWQETNAVTVTDGVFDVILGKISPLNLGFDAAYWLSVEVGSGGELSPRVELTASPYTFRAAVADSAAKVGLGSDGDWTISGNDMYSAVAGNVGVNTENPLCRFHAYVASTQHSGYALFQTSASTGFAGGILLSNNTAGSGTSLKMSSSYNYSGWGDAKFGFVANDATETYVNGPALRFEYDGDVFIAQDAGRVGIGNSTPDYKLDVTGDIRATGTLYGTVDNADKVDGYHAGNSSGQVGVNNGTRCVDLNADMVDGKHASAFSKVVSGTVPGPGSVNVTLSSHTAYQLWVSDTYYAEPNACGWIALYVEDLYFRYVGLNGDGTVTHGWTSFDLPGTILTVTTSPDIKVITPDHAVPPHELTITCSGSQGAAYKLIY